jgi:type VI secretion system secreted protein Hcp
MPIYMRIEGIDGEVTNDQFPNWLEVYSFSWGESRPVSTTTGGGGATSGRLEMSDFYVAKPSGKGSPKLMFACASGKHLPAVQIVETKAVDGRQVVVQRYSLTDCLITSFQVSGDGGSTPSESLSLNFTKIEFRQTYFNADGQGTFQTATWDLRSNSGSG